MGEVIDLYGEKLINCIVCDQEADRLVFSVHVCDSHSVAVGSFVIEAHRAMKLGGMNWQTMRRIIDHVATTRLSMRKEHN